MLSFLVSSLLTVFPLHRAVEQLKADPPIIPDLIDDSVGNNFRGQVGAILSLPIEQPTIPAPAHAAPLLGVVERMSRL